MDGETAKQLKTIHSALSLTNDLLQKSIIVQLGLAGVPQRNIRAVVGCDLNKVTELLKQVKPKE